MLHPIPDRSCHFPFFSFSKIVIENSHLSLAAENLDWTNPVPSTFKSRNWCLWTVPPFAKRWCWSHQLSHHLGVPNEALQSSTGTSHVRGRLAESSCRATAGPLLDVTLGPFYFQLQGPVRQDSPCSSLERIYPPFSALQWTPMDSLWSLPPSCGDLAPSPLFCFQGNTGRASISICGLRKHYKWAQPNLKCPRGSEL